ncbi:hypothetical protein [Gallionella capsiferriformans]|uniref:Uncharacterized protein n=1 Tax=Gallionella capsiferriformans (strain ES-2) TaxID=395494 RepID=D9SK07_GALCS|nr:hypothetical protein [Gallionella capsiferriformans]ADL56419.1 hypothetical protein Galf_2419 [Gallionella capsiferriformans ES-2]
MPKKIVTEDSINQLLAILNNWQGELTWELYCESITRKLGLKTVVTKQTLLRYEIIKRTFNERKAFLREAKSSRASSDQTIAMFESQVNNLVEQVRRLSAENDAYKEKFVRWLSIIYMHAPNFDISKLDFPLTAKNKRNQKG